MIFIVDDDESVRTSLVRLLRSAGLPAQAYATAEDFLRVAPADGCNCVIVDILMTGMNGLELQQLLLRRKPAPRIIMITASEDPALRQMATDAGAVAFLKKPFDDAALLEVVAAAAGGE